MSLAPARWWRTAPEGHVRCELCPHHCLLGEGEGGPCGVRHAHDGALWTSAWGGTSGLAVDPIEKKPLYHWFPGSRVLSFGTGGCNLACAFCQNWSLSRHPERPLQPATPEDIADQALAHGCRSVAFTYNEPVVGAEWCLEVARTCRARGLRTVAVTNGYIQGPAREAFFAGMDAVNVDLKAFTDGFYRRLCGARLAPVLETVEYLARHTDVWLELTTLIIPGENDADDELAGMAAWVRDHAGPDVPLHLSAFHPDFRLLDHPPTDLATLRRARDISREAGLRFVYTGNVHDPAGGVTPCPGCGTPAVRREGIHLLDIGVDPGGCRRCGAPIPGLWA